MQSHVNCRTHRECHLDAEIASFEAALCYEVKQEGQTGCSGNFFFINHIG